MLAARRQHALEGGDPGLHAVFAADAELGDLVGDELARDHAVWVLFVAIDDLLRVTRPRLSSGRRARRALDVLVCALRSWLDGWTAAEVAAERGCEVRTVRRHLADALAAVERAGIEPADLRGGPESDEDRERFVVWAVCEDPARERVTPGR